MWQTLITLVDGGVRPSAILGFLRSGRIATYNDVRKYDRCLTKLFNEIHSLTDEQYIVRFSKYGPNKIFLVVLTPDSVNLHKIPDHSIYNYVLQKKCCGARSPTDAAHSAARRFASTRSTLRVEGYGSAVSKIAPVSFMSIEGKTMLVVPYPRPGLNAVSIREFIETSTRIERCMLWDKVFKTVKPGEYIYTHGFEVPWLHVKIRASVAKYYSKNLLKIFSALEKNNGSTRCFNCGA